MSWIMAAIELEAEARAVEKVLAAAKLGLSSERRSPGWAIDVTFGDLIDDDIQFRMADILHTIEHFWADDPAEQVRYLTGLMEAFGYTIERLAAMRLAVEVKVAAAKGSGDAHF